MYNPSFSLTHSINKFEYKNALPDIQAKASHI